MSERLVLDKATILDRLGGDEEIFTVMADMYLQDCDNYCRELDSALGDDDAPRLYREAHTVKGLLATFADDAGTALASDLEQRAKVAASTAGFVAEVAALKARMSLLADALRQDGGG
ncbi:MAG: Hpt domain-containing protein [Azonexus sp.]|nr:Hpt domain-containing protein [Betaproteobacteria bacterium]MBK8917476.1 Hpt domain-containing protein [Betaproteobacteria bacterium]MBP6036025.1 Hpt domain-containing protein [Azonexus sp.]MBP6906547.1 Hpt domain-containing protein [Azonexus sp.]